MGNRSATESHCVLVFEAYTTAVRDETARVFEDGAGELRTKVIESPSLLVFEAATTSGHDETARLFEDDEIVLDSSARACKTICRETTSRSSTG
jgi:hypothetical protein